MLEFGLLGSLHLLDSEGNEYRSLFSRPKLIALLAYLAAARPLGFHRRDSLVAVFWPNVDQAHARNALRQALHQLRNALGHDAIVGRGEEELALNASQVRCDVVAFHESLEEDQPAVALELYRGELLPGFHVSDAPQFERWLDEERDYLRAQAAAAAWKVAEEEEAKGNAVPSAHWARRALEFTPYDEGALGRLIQLLDRVGDRAGAVQEYEKFARRLADDLEVETSPETKALIEAVRSRDDVSAPLSRSPSPTPSPQPKARSGKPPRRSAARAWYRLTARIFLGKTSLVARLILFALIATTIYVAITTPWVSREEPVVSLTRIAVLPFWVPGGQRTHEVLCEGMVELLSNRFHGAGQVRAVDPRTVLSRVGDRECKPLELPRARELAADMGAGFFVFGNISEIGGRLRFSATLYDLAMTRRVIAEVTANTEDEIDSTVDELARQLIPVVSPARIDSLAAWTTRSFTALRAYLTGQEAIRAGRFDEAVAAFRRAVYEDPEYALAYYALNEAASAAWLNPQIVHDAAEQAFRLAGRLPERYSTLLEASLAQQRGAAADAEQRYKVITGTQQHRDDPEAWFGLAETQFHYGPLRGRSIAVSREAYEQVLRINTVDGFSLYHLAVIEAVEGRFAKMDSLVQRGFEANPDHFSNLGMSTLSAFVHRDSANRDAVLGELSRAGDFPVGVAVGIVSLYSGDLQGGERVARLLTAQSRAEEVRAVGHVVIAHLKLARGQWEDARGELAHADSLDRALALEYRALLALTPFLPVPRDELEALQRELESWDADAVPENVSYYVLFTPHDGLHAVLKLYLLGLLSARLGEHGEALQFARQLEGMPSLPWAEAFARDLALTVRAQVAYENESLEDAVSLLSMMRLETWYQLTSVSSFHSQAYGRFLLAELLLELGRYDEALRWYSSFEHVSPYDLIYLGPSFRGRGMALEQLGQLDQAADYYERFLALWENHDPEFRRPMWVSVEAALARLKAE